MSKTSLLLTASAVSLLTFTQAGFSDAFAQKGLVSSPRTGWAITEVKGQPGQDNGYCAAARRFDTNAILTFARNEQNENSMAVDFQTPRLPRARLVEVILDPGAGEQRRDKVKPISRNAFIVKLGRDDAFMDALERTGQLRLEVAGESFVFNMADIDAGKIQLSSCLANLEELEEAAPVESVEVAALRDDVEALRGRNDDLREMLANIEPAAGGGEVSKREQKKIAKLNKKIDALEHENTALVAGSQGGDVSALRSENALLQSRIDELLQTGDVAGEFNVQLSRLERENEALRTELDMAYAQDVKPAEDYKALKQENRQMKAALDQAEASQGVLRDMRAELARLERENVAFKEAGLDALPAEDAKALEDKIASLREDNLLKAQELTELAALRIELDNLKAQNSLLEQRVQGGEVSQDTLDNLQLYADTLERDNEQLLERNQALELAEKENAKAKIQISKLQSELTEFRERNNAIMAKAEAKLRDFHTQITQSNVLVEQLREEKMQIAAQLAGQTNQNNDLIARLEEENDDLSLKLANRNIENAALAEKVRTENITLAAQLEEQNAKNALLIAELEGAGGEKDRKIVSLEAANAALSEELEAKVAALQDENAQFAAQLKVQEDARDVKLAKLEQANADLLERLDTRGREQDAVIAGLTAEKLMLSENLDKEVQKHLKVLAELQSENDDLSERYRNEVAQLRDENAAVLAKLEASDAKNVGLSEENVTLTAKLVEVEAQQEELEAQNVTLAAQLDSDGAQNASVIAALQDENKELSGTLEQTLKSKDLLTAELTSQLSGQAEAHNVFVANLMVEKIALAERLSSENAKNAELVEGLQHENIKLASQLEEQTSKNESLIASLQEENSTLVARLDSGVVVKRDAIEALKFENLGLVTKLQAQNAENAKVVDALRAENVALSEQLTQDNQKYAALVEQLEDEKLELQKMASLGAKESAEQIAALEAEKASLLDQFSEDGSKVRQIIGTLQRENVELAGLLEQQSAEKTQAVSDVNALRDENLGLSETLAAQIANSEDTTAQLAELEEENAKLRGAMSGLNEQVLALEADLAEKDLILAKAANNQNLLEQKIVAAALQIREMEADQKEQDMVEVASVMASVEPSTGAGRMIDMIPMPSKKPSKQPLQDVAQESVVQASVEVEDSIEAVVRNAAQKPKKPVAKRSGEARVILASSGANDSVEFSNSTLNEAQIHEEQMRRALIHKSTVEDAVDAHVEADESDMEVRMSQDPFEDMDVVGIDDPVAVAQEILAEDIIEEMPVETASLIDEAGLVPAQPVMPAPIASVPEVQSHVKDILTLSNVPVRGQLQQVSGAGATVYQWRADDVYGSSEELPFSDMSAFDGRVMAYLQKTQSRCAGDFAIVPEDSREVSGMRVDSYEVACMGGGVSSAASLVFYNMNGVFTAMAHEAPAEKLHVAMQIRDRIFTTLVSGEDS